MRQERSVSISKHRLARLIARLAAFLIWVACGGPLKRDGHRRRTIRLVALRNTVRNLIIIRAAQMLRRVPRRRVLHTFAPKGFTLRHNRSSLRACAGVWLRRRLRTRGGAIAQAKHLLGVLRQTETLAAALVNRRPRGLTRLRALRPIAPPAQTYASRHAIPAQGINSS